MIRFSKLKLNGFKSFTDRGEIDINVGLTGIVGPNGCGKSNLVEALRWCMGESSARKMRGSGMDDVIFNGTERRPSRNFAEVTLTLDNAMREAPAAYNQHDEIEVTRRINRDKGSNYRINGKAARARDVQLLFADTMTGSNSPALVSQGRVAEIINAKPQDRRHILEESAGVAGLYDRRHEAELRLKAAETNLLRLDDISEGMKSRLDALKRQARQAERYKELNAEIRKLERQIAYVEWYQSKRQQQNALSIYDTIEALVAEKMRVLTALSTESNDAKRGLPKLRNEHVSLTATLHTQNLSLSRLEDEEAKISALLKDSHEQLKRAQDDLNYETKTLDENKAALIKIEQEEKSLHDHLNNEHDIIEPLEQQKAQTLSDVKKHEALHEAELEAVLSSATQRQALENEVHNLTARHRRQLDKLATLKATIKALEDQRQAISTADTAEAQIAELQKHISSLQEQAINYDRGLDKAMVKKDEIASQSRLSQQSISALKAEQNTLLSFLSAVDDETILDDVSPDKGFETALSRALGDTLLASTNPAMNNVWTKGEQAHVVPSFPSGVKPLKDFVKAPDELNLALSFIGLIENCEEGSALWGKLSPGQSLVSNKGSLWRWDGFHVKADAADNLAAHLQHKNRLKDIDAELVKLNKTLQKSDAAAATQGDLISQFKQDKTDNAQTLNQAQKTLRQAEISCEEIKHKAETITAQITLNAKNADDAEQELTQLQTSLDEKTALFAQLDGDKIQQREAKLLEVKAALATARDNYQEAALLLDKQRQEQNRRKARMHAIADERNALKNRTIRGAEQLKKLASLVTGLEERIETNKDRPVKINEEKQKLLTTMSTIEEECTKASMRLSKVEIEVGEAEKKLKAAESDLATAREDRAAATANVANAEDQLKTLNAAIHNNYKCAPTELLNKADYALNLDDSGQDIALSFKQLRAEKDSAVIKREKIGPVNLQAADELEEINSTLGTILKEREDLILAIEELRKAINTLNGEARVRLIATFNEVNDHFKSLFERLYRGGSAYLKLVDSEDALDAGVEIFAQPPGKSLQSLSLMSGGEQTLASIALIFAMFLTNPSPICVLDEVDAPLDDANVDRVCDLLEEIAAYGHTRFLVITHHRLTMARMDRLFGVTMAEQGISQLVSVDLQQELDFLDDAA